MLASARVYEVRGDGDSEAPTGDKFDRDGWVRSGSVTPFSRGVSVGVVSAPVSFVRSSSWGWVKSALLF